MSEFEQTLLACIGFGFGSIFWAFVFWVVFGKK